MNYTFYAHTACDYYEYSGAVAIHFVVHFNGVTIVPSTRVCTPCTGKNCYTSYDVYYPVSANITAPASGVGVIQFVVTGSPAPDGGAVVPMVLDHIYLFSPGADAGYKN